MEYNKTKQTNKFKKHRRKTMSLKESNLYALSHLNYCSRA